MTRQYAPRLEQQRAGTQSRIAFPGSAAGTVRNTRPIQKSDRLAVRVPTSTTLSAETFWVEDHFTVTSTSPGTFALSYVPRTNSEDITVNGVTLLPTTDWTRSGTTLTIDSGVWLGLSGTWDLLVQYEVASAAASSPSSLAPVSSYAVTANPLTAISLPASVSANDVAFLVTSGDSSAVSGGFLTWTKIYDGSGLGIYGAGSADVWMGRGVGTGSTVSVSAASCSALAVYHDVVGTVSVRNHTTTTTSGTTTPIAPALATAVVGDIAVSVVNAFRSTYDGYYPSGTYTPTGIGGDISVFNHQVETSAYVGVGIVAGTATATSVGCSFALTSTGTGGTAEALNFAIQVV